DNDHHVVAPAAGARLRSYKVFGGSGGASMAQVLCGVDHATHDAMNGDVQVVNMSLGGGGDQSTCATDPAHAAICTLTEYAVVVVAAGNNGIDAAFKVPASYPEVITVASLNDFDGLAGGQSAPVPGCAVVGRDDM